MNVVFRVDASLTIGTGHVMRCLTLANALKMRGLQSYFVSRHMPEHLQKMLCEHEHEFTLLQSAFNEENGGLQHSAWLGTTQEEDARATLQMLDGRVWHWLIVDHYALDSRWEKIIRPVVERVMVIDDIADRAHDCDVLLDQNLYADMGSRYAGKIPSSCLSLLGPRYALLRDEFRQLHNKTKSRAELVKRVLVFFGGADAENYTALAIEALAAIGLPDLQVDVVIGAAHPAKEAIEALCIRYGFVCHIQTKSMAELMALADISIGAGGGATWERCCLGLPTVGVCIAENQRRQLADAAIAGLLYMPNIGKDIQQTITRHVTSLIENPTLRMMISVNCMQIVDGRGAMRIASVLGVGIHMRVATSNDSRDLFNWRNHTLIRAASRNSDLIVWEEHQRWFDAVLVDPNKILLIGTAQGSPMGVVRFDLNDMDAEISIYLIPGEVSSGMGAELLLAAEQWLRAELPKVRCIHAHVLGGNERSMRLFTNADYSLDITRFTKRLTQDE